MHTQVPAWDFQSALHTHMHPPTRLEACDDLLPGLEQAFNESEIQSSRVALLENDRRDWASLRDPDSVRDDNSCSWHRNPLLLKAAIRWRGSTDQLQRVFLALALVHGVWLGLQIGLTESCGQVQDTARLCTARKEELKGEQYHVCPISSSISFINFANRQATGIEASPQQQHDFGQLAD